MRGRGRGMKRVMGAAALFAAAAASSSAGVAAQRPSVAILGVASEEGDDDLAAAITGALREQLDADSTVRVSSSRASLSQMTMLQDCDIVEADCRMRVGKAVNADQVLYGGLRRAGTRGHEVEVHLFTTQDGQDSMARRALPAGDTGEAQLAGHARALLATLRGEAQPEAQTVAPSEDEDGPPPVATVTPDVQPLDEAAADSEQPSPAAAPSSNDWLGYTLLGVAGVSAVLTVVSWTQIKAAESDDDFVAYGNAVYRMDRGVKDVCEKADDNVDYGVDAQTLAGARSSCDKGQTFDLLQYVFIGATLVSAGFGTYFLLDDEDGGGSTSGELSVRARVGRGFGLVNLRLDL